MKMVVKLKHAKDYKAVDFESFMNGHNMEVRRAGFSVAGVALVSTMFQDNNLATDMTTLREHARKHNMSVTFAVSRTKICFRRLMKDPLDDNDFKRASGDVLCDVCKLPYREHPQSDKRDFLNVLCNGRRVKL